MAALPAANLLDDYLHSTLLGRQCTEQTVSDCPVPAETMFLHSQVLQGVHQALDSALAGQGATSLDSPTSWRQLPQGTTAAGAAWSPVRTAQARAAASTDSNRPAVTPRGIFRAMRQADASAFYAQQLAAERGGLGQVSRQQHMQQVDHEPTFPAADAATAEVRLLADHAAFSSKLQRMQQDMEVRSYRQSLLHKLQQPSALFDLSQEQSSAQQQQAAAGTMPRCSSAVMWQLGDRMMPQPEPRPCTAPKPSVRQQAAASSRPPAAAGHGAVNAPQSSLSCQASWSHLQQQAQGQSAMQAAAAGCDAAAGCSLASTAPSQLQHLKHLADLELPWKPPAAAQGSAGAFTGCYRPAQQQSRPASPCSSSRSGGSSAAGHRLFLQSEQQQQSVPRPASAVAALQQSLGELARLKAKYGQQQQRREEEHQQQLRTQQEQRWQEEQQQRRQEQHNRDLRRDNWLQATAASQHQTHTLHAAAAAGAADTWARKDAGCASRAYKWTEQDTAHCNPGLNLGSNSQQRQRSGSSARIGVPGYSRWDAWQQQVHSDRQPQLPQQQAAHRGLGGALDALLSEQSLLRQQQAAQESLRRSKSAPRLHRAWDVPLESRLHDIRGQQQRVSARVALFSQERRSSSPGDRLTTRGLRSSWEDSTWQLPRQQQQRPKTAGACISSGAGFDRSKPTAGLSSSAATGAGWLNSSPGKRANRLAAAQGTGVATAAGGRFQTQAATAAGTAATMHAQHGGLNRTGAGVGTGVGSSWLAAGAGSSGGRWGEQLQRTAAGSSLPSRLRTAAGVTGVLATGGAPQRSWLPQSAAPQAPVGACKAALLASRAAGAGGAVGGAAAATGSAAARRQELVQRALNGYKPRQVSAGVSSHSRGV